MNIFVYCVACLLAMSVGHCSEGQFHVNRSESQLQVNQCQSNNSEMYCYITQLCQELDCENPRDSQKLCKLEELWNSLYSLRNSPNILACAMTTLSKVYGDDQNIGFALLLTQADSNKRLKDEYDACIVQDGIEMIGDANTLDSSDILSDEYKEKLRQEGLV